MRRTILSAAALVSLAACNSTSPEVLGYQDFREVQGVEEGDMLKMRAGPGTGYDVLAGLPNGTVVRVNDCSRLGGTRWCRVALDRAPGFRGYVSETYLRRL